MTKVERVQGAVDRWRVSLKEWEHRAKAARKNDNDQRAANKVAWIKDHINAILFKYKGKVR